MKRLLSILLVLCMSVSLFTGVTFAAETVASGTCGGDVTWTLDADGTLTISGTGAMTDYSSYSYAPWYSRSNIKKVIIKDGVMSIGEYAFYGCESLTSITIPNSVTSIRLAAFQFCESLTSVEIPDSVTSIGNYAFHRCDSLISITIPNNVTSIGAYAFDGCYALTDVYYGGSETDRTGISIGTNNTYFINATWHYMTKYNISVSSVAGGVISTDKQEAPEGEMVTVTATPADGYELVAIYVNGSAIDGGTFTMPASDVEVTAVFEAIEYEVESIAITGAPASMLVGDTATLSIVATPVTVTTPSVTWASNNVDVATVENGTVTAVGAGTATITATTVDGGLTARCTVTVTAPVTPDDPVDTPTITVGSVIERGGETVDVEVHIANNPGFVSMRLAVEYDSEYLTLTEVSDGEILGTENHKNNILSWENDTAEEDITANGKIVTLTFTIAEGAPEGTYPVTVSYDNVNREDILNFDLETVEFTISGGAIVVNGASEQPQVNLATEEGAQIRTKGVQGLRFTSTIDKTSADFSRVEEFGMVLIPSADISDVSELQIGATLSGRAVAKVKAKNLYDVTDSTITFTAVLTDIQVKNYTRAYTARAYAILDDGSVVYGDSGVSRSIYQVAERGLQDPGVSAADKTLFQAIVDAVEKA